MVDYAKLAKAVKDCVNSVEDYRYMHTLLKERMFQLQANSGLHYGYGVRVQFDSRNRGVVRGSIVKVNPKNLRVKADNGLMWTVAKTLVTAEKTPDSVKPVNTRMKKVV